VWQCSEVVRPVKEGLSGAILSWGYYLWKGLRSCHGNSELWKGQLF
jgi:hypothetical protein